MRLLRGLAWRIVVVVASSAALSASAAAREPDASDEFFDRRPVPELRIRLEPKQIEKLRGEPRKFVEGELIENGAQTWQKVRVKLKGAAGSFRPVDDRPALTVSLKKSDARYHGLEKFHLNNSVQDESYLEEFVASQVCLEAGCPTARVAHARVWLNERDLGLYVLKEGYDELFLARHFANPTGNLYDGGFCQDIDGELEKDAGQGPDDRSDLAALVAACREPDPARRWPLVEQRLDVDAFLDFVALELMLCHWDGYAQGRNNYRVYFRADDQRAIFIPHGLDQILDDSNASVFHLPEAIVAHAVLENEAWRAKYRERVERLLPLFAPERLAARIDAGLARVRPMAEKIAPDFAGRLDELAQEFKDRVKLRQRRIMNPEPPETLAFNDEGWTKLADWAPRGDDDAGLEEEERDGKSCLVIAVGPSRRTTASFRTRVLLARGSYRLEAKVKTIGVYPVIDEKGPGGAGVRISGSPRLHCAKGTSDWRTVAHGFRVDDDSREVELIAELRASAGQALFDTESLRLYKAE